MYRELAPFFYYDDDSDVFRFIEEYESDEFDEDEDEDEDEVE